MARLGWVRWRCAVRPVQHHCASIAVLNTNASAATSFLTCTCLDVIFFGRPSVIGAVQSMISMSIAGLVCITATAAKLCGKKCPQNVDYAPELTDELAIAFTFFSSLYM